MAENKLADMSTEFAVKILNLTDGIKGHYSLANQLERSGTSIGANIREAKYAHSKADFVTKNTKEEHDALLFCVWHTLSKSIHSLYHEIDKKSMKSWRCHDEILTSFG